MNNTPALTVLHGSHGNVTCLAYTAPPDVKLTAGASASANFSNSSNSSTF
jgi:hypothetical protein